MTKQELYQAAAKLTYKHELWIREKSKPKPKFTWADYCKYEDSLPLEVTILFYDYLKRYFDGETSLKSIRKRFLAESKVETEVE